MKNTSLLVVVFCVASLRATEAQTPLIQENPQHIVTVNFNAVAIQTAEAQRDLNALQAKLAPRQAVLKALNDEVEALRKQIDNTSDKLSETERFTQTRTLASKEKQLQREAEDFKNDSQNESQQIFQRVGQKVFAFLQTYSKQHAYSAVIERGSDTSPIVWYAAPDIDITDDVIKAYDAQAGIRPTSSDPSQRNPAKSPPSRP
jgi:outer membrane protein